MSEHDLIKKTKKILTESQYKFLKQLAYWSLSKKDYGLRKEGKTWIYNTYEQWANQLHVSISTVRRTIKALQDLNFINLDYLSTNKRNRTLYYSINFDVIEEFLNAKTVRTISAANIHVFSDFEQPKEQINEHICEHMYIDNKKQDNKSNKSHQDDLGARLHLEEVASSPIKRYAKQNANNYSDTKKIVSAKNSQTVVSEYKNTGCNVTLPVCRVNDENYFDAKGEGTSENPYTLISKNSDSSDTEVISPKTTTVQDMMKILKEELFAKQEIHLNKQLSRYLVASFNLKFEKSLENWKRYLRLIKTSAYMMGEKFKLSVWWILKFATIDRIRAGELGVDESKIPEDASEVEQKALDHIESVEESETCKQYRREVIRKLSPSVYLSWFTKVDLIEEARRVVIRTANKFVRDYINANFFEKIPHPLRIV